jgi:hypothetical protein
MKRQFTMTFNCDSTAFDDHVEIQRILSDTIHQIFRTQLPPNHSELITDFDGKTIGCFGLYVS